MEKDFNPFVSIGYRGPAYFCDRKQESKQLQQFMLNGVNVTLFAIRRLGKTGLIHHVFYPYKNSLKIACIYVDILATNNISDFTNQLATAVYNRFPAQKTLGRKLMELFQRFRPVISFDELTGNPSLSLTMQTTAQKENTIGQIFNFLDQQNVKVVFAIDEFQQILDYPETNTEALLRTCIQGLKNICFVFCGSNQKMMHEIFNSAKRPFFASCSNMNLTYINQKEYKEFIDQKFKENNRNIDVDCIDFICEFTKLHTFYTQYFCFMLFAKNKQNNTLEDAHETALSILKLNENTFFQYKNLLTISQWNILLAIAKQEKVHQPQAKEFIANYKLGTPALVKRGLDALLKKELVFYNSAVENPYYEVYDKYLMRWMQYK
ncbi:MAG: ATP-binding protein [Bacteroidetes bacterium]|nr:ATP-binding protein [Bacteroidota bacterium]HET6244466.1 ATP-binding protein [Bacteroidia bacterium]